MATSYPNLKIRTNRLVYVGRKLQSPWGRSLEQYIQGRWRAVATAFSSQPRESLRSTVLAKSARGITGQSPLPNTAFPVGPEHQMLSHGSGDCPTDGYVALNLKIRTKRLVYDGRKLQSLWGRSPEQCIQGQWRAVATAFSGLTHESLRSTVLA